MTLTIDHPADTSRGPVDPATDMLADIQPRDVGDLLDLAGLVGEVDGGHIISATVVVA
ncbi:UNVERIFIED_ORG: hypothetical protein L601_000800000470 [Gordonia westfalica J30]